MQISILYISSLLVAAPIVGQSPSAPTSTLAEAFSSLEPTIQGAAIGGAAALVGTFITVMVAAVVTWMQLRHATQQRDKDRALELKKEVLLEAVEGLTAASGVISQLPNVDISDQQLSDQFQLGNQRTIRAGAVAGRDTVRALAVMRREVVTLYMKLLPQRQRLLEMKTDADIAAQGVERALAEQRRLSALREQMILQNAESRQIEYLEAMWEFSVKGYETTSGERDRLFHKLMEHRKAFVVVCVREHLGLQDHHTTFMECVRLETGVDTVGDQSYADATRVDEAELLAVLDTAFEGLDVGKVASTEQAP